MEVYKVFNLLDNPETMPEPQPGNTIFFEKWSLKQKYSEAKLPLTRKGNPQK